MSKKESTSDKTKTKMTELRAKLMKTYGSEAIIPMTKEGAQYASSNTTFISTGSIAIDKALGRPGLPLGRIVEIYGPESSGKTTLTLHVLAEAQKLGHTVAIVDAEHAIDPDYATSIGVSFKEDRMIFSQPDSGEQALNIVESLIDSTLVRVIVVDSVAALTPQAEINGEIGDSHVGLQARMMGQALRKITSKAHKNNVMVIFINQLRMKIGVMFGSPETTPGGNALKFFASVRLDIRRIGGVKENSGDGAALVANKTRVKVKKNKLAPPFREAEFEIKFGIGIDKLREVFDGGMELGLITRSGAWFSIGDKRLAQGALNASVALASDEWKDQFKEIEEKVRAA